MQESTITQGQEFAKTKKTKKEIEFSAVVKNAERFEPSAEEGLNESQVASRQAAGLRNIDTRIKSKSYLKICSDNILTFFNLIWAVVAAALLIVGAPDQLFFLAIVGANTAIGIYQEIRAKHALEKLELVGATEVTVVRGGQKISVKKDDVLLDDIMFIRNGQQITSDCIVAEGSCEVNEAMLTGESVAIPKNAGDQMFAGSFISRGNCYARVDKIGSDNYIQSLISYAKTFKSNKSKLLLSLKKLINIIAIIIVPLTVILGVVHYLHPEFLGDWKAIVTRTAGATTGMVPSGMYLLTSVALFTSFIKLAKNEVWVQELYSIEMLARVNVLCLDKTGTITDGTMKVREVMTVNPPVAGRTVSEIMCSILAAVNDKNMTSTALTEYFCDPACIVATEVYPFSSEKKYSGAVFGEEGAYIVGAPEFVMKDIPKSLSEEITARAKEGLRVLMLAHIPAATTEKKGKKTAAPKTMPIALIAIEDHIREDAPATLRWFAENNVTCKVISGDNPVTVAAVAKKAGIVNADKLISLEGLGEEEVRAAANTYTVFGRVSPEQKRILVKAIKAEGNTVAMTGDGVNDILALKESDCAVAMAAGSEAARNVAHLVLMDNNFAKMPLVVANGRRVVNNIERSTSVFLMKTIFSIILSLLTVALYAWTKTPYPFMPSQLMIIEVAVIGIPATFLALQPDDNLIKGDFLSNVFRRSLPPGFTLLLGYYALVVFKAFFPIDDQQFVTMSVAVLTLSGWFMLMRVCRPFDGYRLLVVSGSIITVLFSMIVLRTFFKLVPLSLTNYLFVLVIVFASYYIAHLLSISTDWLFARRAKRKIKN